MCTHNTIHDAFGVQTDTIQKRIDIQKRDDCPIPDQFSRWSSSTSTPDEPDTIILQIWSKTFAVRVCASAARSVADAMRSWQASILFTADIGHDEVASAMSGPLVRRIFLGGGLKCCVLADREARLWAELDDVMRYGLRDIVTQPSDTASI